MVQSIPYLGHVIDSEGPYPHPEKGEAIRQAPTPNNVTEVLPQVTYPTTGSSCQTYRLN